MRQMGEQAAKDEARDTAPHFPNEDSHIRDIQEQGYTIIPNAVPEALLQGLVTAIKRLETQHAGVQRAPDVLGKQRVGYKGKMLLNRDPIFQWALAFDPLLAIAERMLGPEFLLHAAPTLAIEPGEPGQNLHTDDLYMGIARPHDPLVLTVIWALVDFTEENGATRLVPGSHKWPEPPRATYAEIAANPREIDTIGAPMKRGSILVIDSAIWHGAGANDSDRQRTGLAISYCRGWMRQQENYQLGIPLETMRGFSPRLRQLCGYGQFQGFVGTIDERNPGEIFFPEAESVERVKGIEPSS
jgi:ectoine hydroxylase-related dioxygenase (phytanoyl-CoA dioxygenase family)